jgi:hypothetical protein
LVGFQHGGGSVEIQVCKRVRLPPSELAKLFTSLASNADISAVEIRYVTVLRLLYDSLLAKLPRPARMLLTRALTLLGLNRILLFYHICAEKFT